MKHLFYIHSHITKKISKQIIKTKDLHKDSIFVFPSRYESLSEYKTVNNIDKIYALNYSTWKFYVNYFNILKADYFVSNLCDKDYFHLYLPQTRMPWIMMLMSHKLCAGFSLIEEGMASYYTKQAMENKYLGTNENLTKSLYSMFRLGKNDFFRDGYTKVYGLSQDSFPGFPRKEIIDIDFSNKKLEFEFTDDDCILVCETVAYFNKEKSTVYIAGFVMCLKILQKKYKNVYFKLHPKQYNSWESLFFKNLIYEYFSEATEIPRNCSLEEIAATFQGIDFIVNLSSVGLYAGRLGNKVFSFSNILAKLGVGIKVVTNQIKMTPELFWKYVNLIE